MTIVSRMTVPAIAVGLLLSGCGSDGTAVTQPAAATSAAAPTAAATPAATAAMTDDAAATPAAQSPTAAPTATGSRPPRGSKVFADKGKGYQIAVPAGFVRITSKAQLAKVYKASAKAIPKSGVTEQFMNKNLRMLAVKAAGNASINVVVVSAPGLTADQMPMAAPSLKKQMKGMGARKIKVTEATLGSDPALRAAYTIKSAGTTLAMVQYITAHDDQAYTVTFTAPGGIGSKLEKQTAASWQFR